MKSWTPATDDPLAELSRMLLGRPVPNSTRDELAAYRRKTSDEEAVTALLSLAEAHVD